MIFKPVHQSSPPCSPVHQSSPVIVDYRFFFGGGGGFKWTYLDVRVFNPLAAYSSNTDISKCYHNQENEKKRVYEQRIQETKHSTFTPLEFSASAGMGRQATVFYQRLAAMLAEKWDQSYGSTLNWMHCSISSLLRSAIQYIRGARSSRGNPI